MDKKTKVILEGYLDKAKEKLRVAEKLFEDEDYEDAVSRAYYSVYHAVQAVLLTEGLTTNSHQGLLNLFGLYMVKTGKFEKKFAKYLSNLKNEREQSDYAVFSIVEVQTAECAIKEAREFIEEAEKYVRGFLKDQLNGE